MADILCRWRNATPQTVVELVNALPHQEMPSSHFRQLMSNTLYGSEFFTTAYQLACQLGLYCECDDVYYPHFTHDITETEAKAYIEFWIHKYYAPNPYTKSLKGLKSPIYLIPSLVKFLEDAGGTTILRNALEFIFKDKMGNLDIVTNAIKNYSHVISINKNGTASLNLNYKDIMDKMLDRTDKKAFFDSFKTLSSEIGDANKSYIDFLSAFRTKPFLLLAGISGTGKSRIVKKMAFDTCTADDDNALQQDPTSPGNYQLIEVKPNWHDSTEVLGYESEINGLHYVTTPFIKFLVKAMCFPHTPFFVCMDEMNLAPVEQYFAEYLSVLESRKLINHEITSEPLIKADVFNKKYDPCHDIFIELGLDKVAKSVGTKENSKLGEDATTESFVRQDIVDELKKNGLRLPQNLIVVGTVNMDETTHQFSRKVIDRAMTIEMNIAEGTQPFTDFFANQEDLTYRKEPLKPLNKDLFLPRYVQASEALSVLKDEDRNYLTVNVPLRLSELNEALNFTPFKIAYRVLNELVLYFTSLREEDENAETEELFTTALDGILMMKVLPRIEGDEDLLEKPLNDLASFTQNLTRSNAKIEEMKQRLNRVHFTSFWP